MGSTHEANLYTASLRTLFPSIGLETSLQVDGGKTGASRFGQGVKESTGPAAASLIRAPMPHRVVESSSLSSLELMAWTHACMNRTRREFMKHPTLIWLRWMKMRTKSLTALLFATITMAPAVVIPATSYNDTVKTTFSHPISNVPGKSLVAVEVSYLPGGASPPHRHSAFV